MMRKPLTFLALLSAAVFGAALPARAASELLWSIPVPADPSGEGFWVPDATMLQDGRAVVLGREGQKVSLMVEEETGALTDFFDIPLEGSLTNVIADPANGLWLTGYTRSGSDAEGIFRDAAVIRMTKNGVIAWARVFGEENEYWAIEDAAVLPSGDLVISGNFYRSESFVARISVSGEWLWDKRFGVAKGTRVGVNENGDIFVVGFASNATDLNRSRYFEHGTIWLFSEDGDLRKETAFRPNINRALESYFGKLAIEVDERETYVATGWNGPDLAPITIGRIAPDGEAIGELALRGEVGGSMGGPSCDPTLASTPERLWLGCAAEGEIRVYEIDRSNGSYSILTAALPECHQSGTAELALSPSPDGLLVLGRRTGYSASGGCAWLMRLTP
jgi:hypothetical protein